MSYNIEQWLFLFFIFTNIGWIQESVIESAYHRRLINRGFLKGPYIPIYGFGGVGILLLCMPFRANGFAVYIVGMLGCTILEYFTGWMMEKLFNKQFWDYSMLKLTYKNRISLLSSLFWGFLALFMVYILFGIVDPICKAVPKPMMLGYDAVMLFCMSIDMLIQINKQIHLKAFLKKLPYEQVRSFLVEKRLQLGRPLHWTNVHIIGRFRHADNDEFSDEEESCEHEIINR